MLMPHGLFYLGYVQAHAEDKTVRVFDPHDERGTKRQWQLAHASRAMAKFALNPNETDPKLNSAAMNCHFIDAPQ